MTYHDSNENRAGNSTSRSSCELRVGGMDCASCADNVRHALEKLTRVDVRLDVVGGRVQVTYAGWKLARGISQWMGDAVDGVGADVGASLAVIINGRRPLRVEHNDRSIG